MDTLSPLNYTYTVCRQFVEHYLFGFCTTGLFIIFGDNYSIALFAFVLLALDTMTGTTYALMSHTWKSEMAWRIAPKGIAIMSAFIVGNIFQAFEPTIGTGFKYLIVTAIIIAEGGSVLENATKINPQLNFKRVFDKFKKL